MKTCPKCNWQNADNAVTCAQCFENLQSQPAPVGAQSYQAGGQPAPNFGAGMPGYGAQGYAANTSGGGGTAAVPQGVAGWNWGAFLLSWVWAIGNSAWIGLLALILPWPIMQIVLGIKGSEWAWQNKRWESVEKFKATQRTWAIVGLVLLIIWLAMIPIFAAILFPVFNRAREAAQMHQGMPNYPIPR